MTLHLVHGGASDLTLRQRLDAACDEGIEPNVRRWLRFAGATAGDVVELAALNVPTPRGFQETWTARCTGPSDVVRMLNKAPDDAPGLYSLINWPVPEIASLRGGANKWLKAGKGDRPIDGHIRFRSAIYADVDPVRPARLSISATLAEREAAWRRAEELIATLTRFVRESMLGVGDSGNGTAVYVALARIPESKELHAAIDSIVKSLDALHSDAAVKIDPAVSNAARLHPAYGTWKRKGENTADRAHRPTGFVVLGADKLTTLEEVQELAARLAEIAPQPEQREPRRDAPRRDVTRGRDESPFELANAVPIRDVALELGMLDGHTVLCPRGCSGGTSVALLEESNVHKCSHQTCNDVGPRGGGVRTAVTLWAEVRGQLPIDAARSICEWRGIELAPRRDYLDRREHRPVPPATYDDAPMPDGPLEDSGPDGEAPQGVQVPEDRALLAAALRSAGAALDDYRVEAVDVALGILREAVEAHEREVRKSKPWRTPEERALALGLGGEVMATGIPTLDRATRGGPRSGRRIVLGGAPGAGKTTLALQLARHYHDAGHAVAIVAADEEADGLLIRWGQQCGLVRDELERGIEGARRHLAERVRSERLLLVDQDEEEATLEDVVEKIAGIAAATERPGALVVDSLQTVRTRAGAEFADQPRLRLDAAMKVVKEAGKRHGLLVIATSEMSRGFYRGGGTPGTDALASFKESGGIEYLASIALALTSVKGESDLIDVEIPKNRGGDKRYQKLRLQLDFDRAVMTEVELPAESFDDVTDRTAEERKHARAKAQEAKTKELAEKIVVAILRAPGPVKNVRQLRTLVGGRTEDVSDAIALLETQGRIGGGSGKPFLVIPQRVTE